MVLVHPSTFDDHVMMDWVPTSVHFDLTKRQSICYIIRGLVEVDKPSFHSPTLDSLSQAAWVIVDDGTPEEKKQREHTVVYRCTIFREYNILFYLLTYNFIQTFKSQSRSLLRKPRTFVWELTSIEW